MKTTEQAALNSPLAASGQQMLFEDTTCKAGQYKNL